MTFEFQVVFYVQNVKIEVCKNFFLNTLSISETTVQTALKKSENGMVKADGHGKTKHNDDQMDQRRQELRQHILSFLVVPNHYCRSSSKLLYLSLALTLSKMYDLYKEVCNQNETQSLSYSTYRQIFQSMNVSFYCPKKDRCETCERFHNIDPEEQAEAEMFQEHRKRATKIREIKTALTL